MKSTSAPGLRIINGRLFAARKLRTRPKGQPPHPCEECKKELKKGDVAFGPVGNVMDRYIRICEVCADDIGLTVEERRAYEAKQKNSARKR